MRARRRRLWQVLSGVAIAVLALVTGSGCSGLFALRPAPVPMVTEPLQSAALPAMASSIDPDEPSDENLWMQLILNPEVPYRALGGVTFYRGGVAMVWPDYYLRADALTDTERTLVRSYVSAVFAADSDPMPIKAEDCVGAGNEADRAIIARGVTDPEREVAAGIACARLRFPYSAWAASTLLIGDGNAVGIVLLRRSDGLLQAFHTNVTRFVARHRSVVP